MGLPYYLGYQIACDTGLPGERTDHSWTPEGPHDHSHPFVMTSRPLLALEIVSRPLPAIQEGLSTTLGPPRLHPDHFQPSRMAFRPLLALLNGLLTTPSLPGEPTDHSQPFRRASQPLPAIREGLSTTPGPPG